jgi:hypothetical protein
VFGKLTPLVAAVLAFLAVFAAVAIAADGIPVNKPFDIPFLVSGSEVPASCLVGSSTADAKPVWVFYVEQGKVKSAYYELVRKDSPNPNPNPDPNPNPQPDPQPNPDVAKYVYLIHESADATPATAAVRLDATWKAEAEKLGMKWLVMDDEASEKAFPQATAQARSKGLPAIVFLDTKGKPSVVSMPKTPAEMLALIRQRGGAK